MNLRSLGILSALALVVPASGNIRTGDNGVEFQSSRSFAFQSQSAPSAHRSGTAESKTTPKRSLRGASPSRRADEKNSFRDEAIPLLEPLLLDEDDRHLVNCGGDESQVRIDLTTDNYGFETSWNLKALDQDGKWTDIESGPPAGYNYESNERYIGVYCVPPGHYKIIFFDMFRDGMCCEYGSGRYDVFVNGSKRFSSPDGDSRWRKRRHRFTISAPTQPPTMEPTHQLFPEPTRLPTQRPTAEPTRKPTQTPPPSPPPTMLPTRNPTSTPTLEPTTEPTRAPTQNPTNESILPFEPKIRSCASSERNLKIEILTDKYGGDTAWEVRDDQAITVAQSTKDYGSYEKDVVEICLEKGRSYEFSVFDEFSDGMCCQNGYGYFKLFLDKDGSWDEIISGGAFPGNEVKTIINLREQSMSNRDKDWLESHNSRRKTWHEAYNTTYVPLKWSNSLKESSMIWAEHLLERCGKGLYHDPDNEFGENLAGNSGSGGWGEVFSIDDITKRFVENEVEDVYPDNGHLTQVLWRASKYVGCAEASKLKEGGGMCHVQACRYARPANCNMNSFKNNDDDWWMVPVMMDESPCGPACPSDGCY